MAPRTSSWPVWSNISSTDNNIKSADDWIEAHRMEDGAETLWRVHDELYDLEPWIKKHPGGPQWLEITKGTDITELFVTYHLNTKMVTDVIRKFYVRQAVTPRKSPFTFKPDGFYNVLKSRAAKQLSLVKPDNYTIKSMLVVDTYILVTLALCIGVSLTQNILHTLILAVLTGAVLGLGTVASHNFTHLKDNWRMYYVQLSMISVREWRISHVFSHHIFTNTVQDLEMTLLYPFIHWFPTDDKPFTVRLFPFLTPVIYPFIIPGQLAIRTFKGKNDIADLLIFVIPALLMLFGQLTVISALIAWLFIVMTSSFMFTFVGFSAPHHFPDNFHDGDNVNGEHMDWGLHQTYTSVERNEPIDNIFLTMATFGDHTLHHLFPALDHSLIPLLQDTFEDTCKEFGLDLTQKSAVTIARGQFKQLVRLTPNDPKRIP
ncbi:Cytochrome b5-like heme/steroid binding domain,Fatty acid desaturase domain [Cinara cedri]|uniref:Cytochrome b5-like heme/steroid binding domain,Fatty acid desaturase domain n=1 Tax=Cinara cedri TaxID=506608 RepID=A0A5E4NMK2_9HEMI|nr:Cytochrome b5-like heme/steroid binding domain,Fatty acid desaturase domain [Cinara cedri]